MTRIIALYLLFCLAFLNVPRFVVHDCEDHEHTSELVQDQSTSDHDQSDESIEGEDCFICEFDLGTYDVPVAFSAFNKPDPAIPFAERNKDNRTFVYFDSYLLRGPPTC